MQSLLSWSRICINLSSIRDHVDYYMRNFQFNLSATQNFLGIQNRIQRTSCRCPNASYFSSLVSDVKGHFQSFRERILKSRLETPGEVQEFIADVVDQIAQAVVHIKVYDPLKPAKNNVLMSGTGFIVSSDGIILTNAHVIMLKPKTRIEVILHDGRQFEASIEHADEVIDLACIKISANDLPCVKFGETSKVKSGEWVIALGNPFGFTHTVTYGVVSSTNRGAHEINLYGKSMEYIQTDATINEGNSGGPLVNLDGEVIGVNVLRLMPGISFSIPVDVAKRFLEVCRKRIYESTRKDITSVDRYVGIAMITLTDSILREMRTRGFKVPLHVTNGLLVRKVNEKSPGSR